MSDLVAQGKNLKFYIVDLLVVLMIEQKNNCSFVKIMNHAQVNFGVLLKSLSGDVAKRAGNEFLFQIKH